MLLKPIQRLINKHRRITYPFFCMKAMKDDAFCEIPNGIDANPKIYKHFRGETRCPWKEMFLFAIRKNTLW